MARDRQSRRAREASADRQQRLIYYAAAGTLLLVVVVIVVGLFVTRYLPPRAHVLSVEDRDYNASEIVHRGNFMITVEGRRNDLGDAPAQAVDQLIFEEALRRRGPDLVGPVTKGQIDAQLQLILGFDPREPAVTPTPGADDSTGDGASTDGASTDDPDAADSPPEATPRDELFPPLPAAPRELTESEQDDYSGALKNMLSSTGLSLPALRDIAEALAVRALLNRHFDEVLGPSGEQLRLSRIRVNSPAEAADLHQRFLDGASFEDLVRETDDTQAGAELPGDLGWFPREVIPDDVKDALEGVESGGLTEVVDRGLSFELYYVSEIDPDRIWEDAARRLLVSDMVDAWAEEAQASLAIEIDLSDGEESWILERVVSHVSGQLSVPSSGGQ